MRVLRNFAFMDLSGFTALTEAQGDERAVNVLTSFRGVVREICSRRGVRIAKWLGDGAMLVSVEPRPLLAAMLELQRAVAAAAVPTAVRCGVSSGEVILLEGDDYIGHAVNVAARLCDVAPGGVVYAVEPMIGDLPRWGAVLKVEDLAIRGLERSLVIASLGLAPVEGAAEPDPVCGIPLTKELAEEWAVDFFGQEVWFCSDSCRDTWERRPRPVIEGQGSLRTPLIGT